MRLEANIKSIQPEWKIKFIKECIRNAAHAGIRMHFFCSALSNISPFMGWILGKEFLYNVIYNIRGSIKIEN